MSFEDFSLYDAACKGRHSSVWLTFGGDQGEVTAFCCTSATRKKEKDLEVEGRSIPLVRDDSLREFLRVVRTGRLRRPDGRQCADDECYFYRPLSATIKGMFFAGADGMSPGYGHLGCCHLLVINQVTDVSAERTLVPAGGSFQCPLETWHPTSTDSSVIRALLSCSKSESKDCDRNYQTTFGRIADHWHDHVDLEHGHTDRSQDIENSAASWISADLMNRYEVLEDKPGLPVVSVTRQVCTPLGADPQKLPSYPIACEEYSESWENNAAFASQIEDLLGKNEFETADAKIAEASKSILPEGDQLWRSGDAQNVAQHALLAQAQKWRVVPDPALQATACQDVSLEDQKNHLMDCGWHSSNGMQEFGVRLQKPKSDKGTGGLTAEIPWAVTSIYALVCH
jgi:hypothetical protein